MAPSVRTDRAGARPRRGPRGPPLRRPATRARRCWPRCGAQVEESSDYVGLSFAAEARKMHEGEAPERSIWGEARPDEARALIEDGIPVAPLPFRPRRSTN